MPVTIHVNGTSNSLVHKGSMGVVKSTLPDVCKTPSPGGPIPVPYPVIISMSAQLAKGTTTVKADGGNMCGVKGSEISMCNGDNAGTAGGVKSSTFMKEATWILYSFDVKLDGKNACRLSDKMQMNHGNTACLGGITQQPVNGTRVNVLELECKPGWTPCQKEQMKAKAAALNRVAKGRGGLKLRPKNRRESKKLAVLRARAEKFQRKFRKGAHLRKNHVKSSCAPGNEGRPVDADHLQELQTYGKAAGPFKMLDSSVNRSSGGQIRSARGPSVVTVRRVKTKNC